MRTHWVSGGNGAKLHVREWGRESGPSILFIHGWSQNHLCWRNQYESPLAEEFRLVAFDLRGHGMSDAPPEAENYTRSELWAGDIAAIIEALRLDSPVLVPWSYGGYVACDYLSAFGTESVAGVNFVAAAVTLSEAAFGTLIGGGFLDHVPGATDDDLPTNIETMRSFVRACTASSLAPEDHERALCWNMAVPASVRGALLAREIDSDALLAVLDKPVLVSHGEADTLILPAMSQHILSTCPRAAASWYAGAGHAPFLEKPDRFNRELARFAHDACSGSMQGSEPSPAHSMSI